MADDYEAGDPLKEEAANIREADLLRFRRNIVKMDERSSSILSFHSALEVEMQRWLDTHLPRGGLLKQMSFGQKVSIIKATWFGDEGAIDKLMEFLLIFNNLRNSIAHGDERSSINRWLDKLQKQYEHLPGSGAEHKEASLEDMVADICGTLAGITYKLSLQRARASRQA